MAVIIPYRLERIEPPHSLSRKGQKEVVTLAKKSRCRFGPLRVLVDFFASFAVKLFPVSDIFGLQPLFFRTSAQKEQPS